MIGQAFVPISKIKMNFGFEVLGPDAANEKQHCAHRE
jgi:hypothetical protein